MILTIMENKPPERLPLGEEAPDFTLPDLDGQAHRLSEFRGRIILLNFWSAECPWSERCDQTLRPLLESWGERVVYLPVASNANESPELLKRSAAGRGLATVLWDANSQVAALYRAEITPQFFVLDETGLLRYQGAFDDINFRQKIPTRNYVREVVEALLSGLPVQTDHAAAFGCTIVKFSNLVA